MSAAPDEKKEAEIEGELSWSGVKIPDHFHLSWFASVMGWGGVALAINGYPGVKQDYGTKAQDRMHDIDPHRHGVALLQGRRPHPRRHPHADGVLHPRADGQARGDAQVLARLPPEADLIN